MEEGRPGIQRDDEQNVFSDDDEARAYVRAKAAAGSAMHTAALALCKLKPATPNAPIPRQHSKAWAALRAADAADLKAATGFDLKRVCR